MVGQRDRVAHAHQLFRFLAAADANVQKQIVNLRRLRLLLLLHQMRRHVSDYALDRTLPRMNHHPLRFGNGRIHPAHLAHINVAIVGDIIDRHGDFVRVPGQHQPRRSALVQHRHAIAIGIGESFIGKLPGIIEPDSLSPNLMPHRAGRVHKRFKELKR